MFDKILNTPLVPDIWEIFQRVSQRKHCLENVMLRIRLLAPQDRASKASNYMKTVLNRGCFLSIFKTAITKNISVTILILKVPVSQNGQRQSNTKHSITHNCLSVGDHFVGWRLKG